MFNSHISGLRTSEGGSRSVVHKIFGDKIYAIGFVFFCIFFPGHMQHIIPKKSTLFEKSENRFFKN